MTANGFKAFLAHLTPPIILTRAQEALLDDICESLRTGRRPVMLRTREQMLREQHTWSELALALWNAERHDVGRPQ